MLTAFGLELFGAPHPIGESSWPVGAHPDLVALLLAVGPGRLCALFDIRDPSDGAWEALRRRFVLHRGRGFWPGLSCALADRVVVFATDDRGAALACTTERFWLLGPRGEVFEAGESLAALVRFLCRSVGRTYATQLDPRAPFRRADDGGPPFELDFGCRPVFVAAGTPGVDAYLGALRSGGDADSLLEGAMTAMPLLLSHRELLSALAGPRGDGIAQEDRAEAVALVARIALRREPSFAAVLPPSFDARAASSDPAVREWATAPPRLSVVGPFASPDPDPEVDPIRVEFPLNLEAYLPTEDAEAWIGSHAARLRGANPELARELEQAALALSASDRAGFVRQVTQLDSLVIHLGVGADGGLAWESDPEGRAAAAASRLRDRRSQAWPILALGVAGSTAEMILARSAAALSGFEHPSMPRLWLHAITSAGPSAAYGADAPTFAERLAACCPVTDALVESQLPALREGGGVAALLLSKRLERDDVMRALLAQLPQVLCAQGWDGAEPPARRAPSVTGPWVSGPLGPITRALVAVGDARVLDRLRAVARTKRADLLVRTEAARGLVAARAPGADGIVDEVEQAWERYWRI